MSRRILPVLLLLFLLIALDAHAQGLTFGDVRVSVDYDDPYTYRLDKKNRLSSESGLLNNSVINAEVLPGSNVTLTFWVMNSFTMTEDIKIRGITSTVTIEEIDDGADADFDSEEFDLDPGNDYRIDLKFNVPIDADRGTYNVIIEAQGDDKNGIVYTSEHNLKLEIKKLSHDIRLYKILLNPPILSCGTKTKLTAQIINAGQSGENDVGLEFRSGSLGISSYDLNIQLDNTEDASVEDKTFTKNMDIDVPKFISPGRYQILANLYWKNYILFDKENIELDIRECDKNAVQNETKSPEVVIIQNVTKKPAPVTAPIPKDDSLPIGDTSMYIILFGGVAVIAIFSMIAFWNMR